MIFNKLRIISFLICTVFVLGDKMWEQQCSVENNETIRCSYLPQIISTNVTKVKVEEFDMYRPTIDGYLYVDSVVFSHESWKKVKFLSIHGTDRYENLYVYLREKCFIHLTGLKELHVSLKNVYLQGITFFGLSGLSVLNLSGSWKNSQSDVESSFNSPLAVPNLSYIDFSNIWNALPDTALSIDRRFISIIFSKPIKGIKLSYNQIQMLDSVAFSEVCGDLEYINISNSVIEHFGGITVPMCNTIGTMDMSYTNIFMNQKKEWNIRIDEDTVVSNHINKTFATVENIRLDGVTEGFAISGGALITAFNDKKFRVTSLSIRNNKIVRLDAKFNISFIQLTHFDLSKNALEFFHPLFVYSSRETLQHLDLSDNKLSKMVSENETLFSQIASSYPSLRFISLAANRLSAIPDDIFERNIYLEVVDLSRNDIKHFALCFNSDTHLKELFLHDNNIHTLDSFSMKRLDSLIESSTSNEASVVNITLDSNPIQCDKCENYEQIHWILKSSAVIMSGAHTSSCIINNDKMENITMHTVDRLNDICNQNVHKNTVIIFVSISIVLFVFVMFVIVWLVKRHRKRKVQRRNMEETIGLIQTRAEGHEFVVFLSYSNEDEHFVSNNVFAPLQTILQELTNTDRSLLCTGDANFHLGRWIAEETVCLLKRSSVVVIVVSNTYCQSRYCKMEFEQAYDLGKPIMLMFKETVNEDVMYPVMKDLFHRFTRIVWAFEENEYMLKTSWQNVGNSILSML